MGRREKKGANGGGKGGETAKGSENLAKWISMKILDETVIY